MANKGHNRERQVKRVLEDDGWWVARAAGSLGDADLVACRPRYSAYPARGAKVLLIEVKANVGSPWMNFRGDDRIALVEAAERAGATAWLAWWPPRGDLSWIPAEAWPEARVSARGAGERLTTREGATPGPIGTIQGAVKPDQRGLQRPIRNTRR